ncbi:MAG: hypothetical protein WCT26_05045 [Candidatus Buchananbacteria bacterium]|jgi:hypothetical protein
MITRERKVELLKEVKMLANEIAIFLDEEIAALENQDLFEDNGTLETALQIAEDRVKEKFIKLKEEETEMTDDDYDYILENIFSPLADILLF